MKTVDIYYRPTCPYCQRALQLLENRGADFSQKVNISAEPERRDEMIKRSGGRTTVPQIFIDDQHVGGCDDLEALESQGRLDAMLQG